MFLFEKRILSSWECLLRKLGIQHQKRKEHTDKDAPFQSTGSNLVFSPSAGYDDRVSFFLVATDRGAVINVLNWLGM